MIGLGSDNNENEDIFELCKRALRGFQTFSYTVKSPVWFPHDEGLHAGRGMGHFA